MTIAAQDTEPEGRMPWTVLSRLLWRRPRLGMAVGVGELLVGFVLTVLLVTGAMSGW